MSLAQLKRSAFNLLTSMWITLKDMSLDLLEVDEGLAWSSKLHVTHLDLETCRQHVTHLEECASWPCSHWRRTCCSGGTLHHTRPASEKDNPFFKLVRPYFFYQICSDFRKWKSYVEMTPTTASKNSFQPFNVNLSIKIWVFTPPPKKNIPWIFWLKFISHSALCLKLEYVTNLIAGCSLYIWKVHLFNTKVMCANEID